MPPSVVSSLDFRRQQEKSRWGCDWSFLHQDGRLNGNRVYKRDDFIIALGELHVWTEEVTYMTASVLKNRGWWLFYVFMRGEKKGWSFFNDFFHLLIFLIPWVVKLTFCSIFLLFFLTNFSISSRESSAQYYHQSRREILQHRLGKVNYDGVNMQM